ncbi:MAG: insulinase family protein [Firmicutes bacterium]|jgi:predicted Zn-dependent peptidase|nr:insulinase family protein [Bacillota bacterium]HPU02051.1 pitrilysin family protein [Bacillota bacterium]
MAIKSRHSVREFSELQEKLFCYTIYPGMPLYVLPKPGYQKKYAIFAAHFGSIDNRFRVDGTGEELILPEGVAHFLEHKLFEDERGNVFDRFAAYGASSNAFTSFTYTGYLFSTTDHFPECLELLLDFVQEPYFTEETVSKEQGIIGQEIRMYEDDPEWRVYFDLMQSLYHRHPVREDIAGTVESIARITPELLYHCYRRFYHPGNMALFVAGDVDPEQVRRQVEENIARRNYRELGEIVRLQPNEPATVARQRITREMVVSEPLFNLGFKDPAVTRLEGDALLRRESAMEIMLDMIFAPSEPLFNELYEDTLIDDRFNAGYTAEKSYAFVLIGGETRDPEQLYERIMEAIARAKRVGFSAEQFERHRRDRLGSFMRRFNSLEFIANNYLAYLFRGTDLFNYPAVLRQITLEEVQLLLEEVLVPERHAVSIILPKKS